MAAKLPNGAVVSLGTTYGTAKTMSALSNATEAVATLEASHGVLVGDIIELTSGWTRLNGRVARAKTVATNDVTLELIDTASTAKFPAGSGTGTIREATAWTAITQIVDWQMQGGEQNFYDYAFLDDDKQRRIPTFKSAEGIDFELGDDQALPWYDKLAAADDDKLPRVLRIVLPSGAILFYDVIVSFNKSPSMNKDQMMTLKGSFSLVADVTRYAS